MSTKNNFEAISEYYLARQANTPPTDPERFDPENLESLWAKVTDIVQYLQEQHNVTPPQIELAEDGSERGTEPQKITGAGKVVVETSTMGVSVRVEEDADDGQLLPVRRVAMLWVVSYINLAAITVQFYDGNAAYGDTFTAKMKYDRGDGTALDGGTRLYMSLPDTNTAYLASLGDDGVWYIEPQLVQFFSASPAAVGSAVAAAGTHPSPPHGDHVHEHEVLDPPPGNVDITYMANPHNGACTFQFDTRQLQVAWSAHNDGHAVTVSDDLVAESKLEQEGSTNIVMRGR